MKPHERIIFALDVPSQGQAIHFTDRLRSHVGMFKVGLELFTAEGPQIIVHTKPVMLDLKLHDIPETVERTISRIGDVYNGAIRFMTLHVQQRSTMMRAAEMAQRRGIQLLAVTVLTSMTEQDLKDLFQPDGTYSSFSDSLNCFDPKRRVLRLAKHAASCGINGFVCSSQEVKVLREAIPSATLVVPGIRPAGSEAGDQKRTGTPSQAIQDGADYLVIGRPIRDAEDPVAAAKAISAEIQGLDSIDAET